MNRLNREQWLDEAKELLLLDVIAPIHTPRPSLKIRMAIVNLSSSREVTALEGRCLPSSASAEGINEIYIAAHLTDSLRILSVLLHEIIHAIDDNKSHHRGAFKTIAKACGLITPFTCATPSTWLNDKLQSYVDLLGPCPHARVDLSHIKRQKNRAPKVWCTSCSFFFNTSKLQIFFCEDQTGCITCPACGHSMTHNQTR